MGERGASRGGHLFRCALLRLSDATFVSLQLDHIARQARSQGGSTSSDDPLSLAFACDATQPDSIKAAVAEALKAFPKHKLGTAVYNASIRNRGPFLDQPQTHIEKAVAGSMWVGRLLRSPPDPLAHTTLIHARAASAALPSSSPPSARSSRVDRAATCW